MEVEGDSFRFVVGPLYLCIGFVLPPFYARLIYIFITRKKYRSLECYHIMALSGILQLFAGPGAICSGLLHLVGYDPFNIFRFFIILFSASIAAELCLNFVLVLNRLKVMFDIRTPPFVNKLLMTVDCLYGILYVACLLSPYCGYIVRAGHYTGGYDFSKPYTELFNTVNCILMNSSSILTFIGYLPIIIKILWQGRKTTTVLHKERSVFIYAGVRFAIDTGLNTAFFFVTLPKGPLVEVAVGLTYILNQLLVSPVLYLTLTRSLRNEFVAIFNLNRINTLTIVASSQTS